VKKDGAIIIIDGETTMRKKARRVAGVTPLCCYPERYSTV
jgi:hypothetical protein